MSISVKYADVLKILLKIKSLKTVAYVRNVFVDSKGENFCEVLNVEKFS